MLHNLIQKIYLKLNKHNSGQLKNIIFSLLFKGVGVIIGFYIFRIGLLMLGNESMGVWLTISSISSWITFFDFGIGNGIKNKITEAVAVNDFQTTKIIISTGYTISIIISLALSIIFIITSYMVNWNEVLNAKNLNRSILTYAILISLVSFAIRLSTDLILAVMTAMHKAYYAAMVSFISTLLSLIFLLVLKFLQQKNFLLFVVAMVVVPILPTVIGYFIFFSKNNKNIKPLISKCSTNYLQSFLKLGSAFFIIQLMYLIIFTTDNLIIANLFSPSDVTIYNTAYKYFSIISFVFAIIVTPFWPTITKANANNEMNVIKKVMKTLLQYWGISTLVVLVMIIIANYVYFVWTKDAVKVPMSLTIVMGIYIIVSSWNTIFATYINAVGKIKLQMYSSIIVGVLNIPLCYFFSKTLQFGVTGVILATVICLLAGSVWAPYQYKLLLSHKAKGIWNK